MANRVEMPKRKSRWWLVLKLFSSSVALLLLVAMGVVIRFYVGHAQIKVDYLAKLNATAIAVTPDEWAWPRYQAILASIGGSDALPDETPRLDELEEGSPPPQTLLEWVKIHPDVPFAIRQVTPLPTFGYVYGQPGDSLVSAAFTGQIPYFNEIRPLAQVLASDAQAARESGDGPRVAADIAGIAQIAQQLRHGGPLITELIAVGIQALSLREMDLTLSTTPAILSDAQLDAWDKQLAAIRTGSDVLSLEGERNIFRDALQRIYTDNGKGDGRLARDGLKNLDAMMNANTSPRQSIPTAYGPVLMVALPSRKQLSDKHSFYLDQVEAAMHKRLREVQPLTIASQLDAEMKFGITSVRYAPLLILLPSYERLIITSDRLVSDAEAIRVAIALERYRRREGAYPAALEMLVPRDIAFLPLDPVDGSPLHYRLQSGKPLVYSVGYDRDDDNGRAYITPGGDSANDQAGDPNPRKSIDADWIQYPKPQTPA